MTVYRLGERHPIVGERSWVAPTADVMGNVTLGADVGIWFGAVLRGDNEPIAVGDSSNIQDLCVLHTDPGYPVTVGVGCTIGHRAILHGCQVGDNTLVGMGAVILNGATIGRDCIIGAGALVPENKVIPDGSLVVGLPGKVVREVRDAEVEANRLSAVHYAQNSRRFAEDLAGS